METIAQETCHLLFTRRVLELPRINAVATSGALDGRLPQHLSLPLLRNCFSLSSSLLSPCMFTCLRVCSLRFPIILRHVGRTSSLVWSCMTRAVMTCLSSSHGCLLALRDLRHGVNVVPRFGLQAVSSCVNMNMKSSSSAQDRSMWSFNGIFVRSFSIVFCMS